MRLATWNINSVRRRLDQVCRFIDDENPDILCLQETKVIDELFPADAFTERGYVHQLLYGIKAYNGVAILSRLPLANAGRRDWCGRTDARHVFADLADGSRLHNLYIPAGGDEPDPDVNEKFAHKLQFLTELTAWFDGQAAERRPQIAVGDFNIAPLPTDVWSHRQLLSVVSHTPIEVAHLEDLRRSLDWVDAVRRMIPPEAPLFSWWSYRARDWRRSNRGRRLDHVWVTPDLVDRIAGAWVETGPRSWEQPSDHAPVLVDLSGRR